MSTKRPYVGREMSTLGNVATYINGRAFKPSEWENGGLPIIRIQNLTNPSAPYNYSSRELEEKYKVRKDDLLFAWSASLGAHIWKGNDAWLNQHIFRVVPSEKIEKKYLYYFLLQVVAELYAKTHGSGMVHITKGLFMNTPVPVPSLPEQERIVSKIEELFSKLDASVAELKTAKEKLKVYRQAVLKEALTPEQGWCKCCFSDLMESVRNGYGKKPDDMGEYRILRISSVRPGKVELSDFRCNQTPFKEDDLISENDLLFTRYNGNLEYVGVCACVPQLQEKYAYPDKIIKCTPKLKNPYHSRFLQYSMNQGEARKYIRSKIKTTSGQKGIAGSDIKKVVLWLPELPVQEKIVKMIDEKMSTCDNIEQTIDISLRQAEAMRQSILKHAFKGGL